MQLSIKRSLSEDSDSTQQSCYEQEDEAWQGAQVLRALKKARWVCELELSAEEEDEQEEVGHDGPCEKPQPIYQAPMMVKQVEVDHSNSSCDSAVSSSPRPAHMQQAARAVTSSPKFPAATRSYVWRGPSRRTTPNSGSEPVSDGAEPDDCDDPSASGKSDRDKEWAALTTWLRMNLHQPRTAKRVVLFTGSYLEAARRWEFILNPELTWDDVSPETRLRLRTLPDETAAAFARKYPSKIAREWQKKTQKYKPSSGGPTVSVPLGDMIYSLCNIYYTYEGTGAPAPVSVEEQ